MCSLALVAVEVGGWWRYGSYSAVCIGRFAFSLLRNEEQCVEVLTTLLLLASFFLIFPYRIRLGEDFSSSSFSLPLCSTGGCLLPKTAEKQRSINCLPRNLLNGAYHLLLREWRLGPLVYGSAHRVHGEVQASTVACNFCWIG